MSRRGQRDVVVVGGGVVGAACALALAQLQLDVMLIEARVPAPWSPVQPDLRVFAFAPDNAWLLQQLGVWQHVLGERGENVQPYRHMCVWDAAGGGDLTFDADDYGREQLGWIIENALLADRLWAALPLAGVEVRTPATVQAFAQHDDGASLQLDDGTQVRARLAVAADGAESSLRRLAGIDVHAHDHAQRGVVAYVQGAQSHQDTAWQRFLPGGPLAVLPFTQGRSSIVWSLPDARADDVLALDDDAFSDALTSAFDARLGAMRPLSRRVAFPLRRQLAQTQVRERLLLLGDAAHVVHPLAGQGVNLGLRDVAALRDAIIAARERGGDWLSPSRLARWARTRRSENTLAAHAFDGINRAFSNDAMLATLLRGPLLGLAGRLPPLTAALWKRAAGV